MTTTEDSLAQAIDQPEAYFIPLGAVTEGELSYERFMPTSFTYGAWGPFQHGAPPSALLTRMLERRRLESERMRITRIAVDLLSAVPYTELRAVMGLAPGAADRQGRSRIACRRQGCLAARCHRVRVDDGHCGYAGY